MKTSAGVKPPTLVELRARRAEILAIADRHGASNVREFGSVARGDVGPGSDVAVLVDLEEGRRLLDLAGFHLELEDLLGCRVDVGTSKATAPRESNAEAVPL